MTSIEEALPDPLVPPEVDLRDFGFMPLDVRTLLTSSLWIKAKKDPRVAHAAVSLWCECWHQVPAASLPDDDEVLADLARCDPKEWARVKERALLHFVKCSDGRLYHRHVAQKAMESWEAKVAQRARTKAATEAREAKRRAQQVGTDVQRDGTRDGERHDARDVVRDVHQETGTVKRQGIEEKNPSGSRPLASPPDLLGDQVDPIQQTVPCPYGAIVDAYHRELPTLPKIRLRDGKTWIARQKAMRGFWGWVLSSRKSDGNRRAVNAEEAMAWISAYFARARDNDFVMGRLRPGKGHENWRADFDYLLGEAGKKQVIEKTVEAAA